MTHAIQQRRDNFLVKAIDVHSGRYSYDMETYVNSLTPMSITCKIHGVFNQRPRVHLEGGNCPVCVITKSALTTDTILSRLNEVHGSKYVYRLTGSERVKENISIECPIHGLFTQRLSRHLAGHGCKKCSITNRALTKEAFVDRAVQTHGSKYDYSGVIYKNIHTKVSVMCPTHGLFSVTPALHIQRTGCPKCRSSVLHTAVRNSLITHNIKFIEEYRFDDCRDKYPLPFDFYCPQHETVIECDGEHHQHPVNFCGNWSRAVIQFELTKHHDTIKTTFAKERKIQLLRISYTQYSDVDELISQLIT